MKIEDLTIEVRDEALNRLGTIPETHLNLTATWGLSTMGAWELTLPSDSPFSGFLRQPKAGIVITHQEETIFSGPVSSPEVAYSQTDLGGSIKFAGVGDTHILYDRLCFPQPSNANAQTQNADKYTLNLAAESIMHKLVEVNVGPLAPTNRRDPRLSMGYNAARGTVASKSVRFEKLSDVATALGTANNLGYQIIQRGDQLVFETYAFADRTDEVRLSLSNGSLTTSKIAYSPPGLTIAIVGGKGSGSKRLIREFTTPKSEEAESRWGRRIEEYVDQSQSTNTTEMKTAALKELNERGFTVVAGQSIPAEDTAMRFGFEWFMGDTVSVEFEDEEIPTRVSGAVLKIDEVGARLGVTLGDPIGFDPIAKNAAKTEAVARAYNKTALEAEIPSEAIEAHDAELIEHASTLVIQGGTLVEHTAKLAELQGVVDQIPPPSDGTPPSTAPMVTARPFGVAAAEFSWLPIANGDDPVTYEVAVALAPSVPVDGSASLPLTHELRARLISIAGVDIPMGSTVYAKVRAVDVDGAGPWSSEVSAVTVSADDYITARFISSLRIEVSQLIAGTLDADVSIVGRLYVSDRADWDGETGVLTIYARDLDSQGNKIPLIRLDPDGSVFKGRVEADDISVMRGLILLGTDSHIASGAKVTVDSGVANPTTPPSISLGLVETNFLAVPSGYIERGIRWDGAAGCWLRLIVPTTGDRAGRCKVQSIATSGTFISEVTLANIAGIGEDDFNGIVRIDDYYYTAITYSTDARRALVQYNLDGSFVARSSPRYNVAGRIAPAMLQFDSYRLPGLVYVNTQRGFSSLEVEAYDVESLSMVPLSSSYTSAGIWAAEWSTNVMHADVTYGAGSVLSATVVAGQTARRVSRDSAGVWQYQEPEAFDLGQSVATSGGAATNGSGTWFASYGTGKLQKFSNWYPAPTDSIYAAYTNTDGAAHTAPSPIGSTSSLKRRWWAMVDVADAAGSVTGADVYVATGATQPALSSFAKRSETLSSSRVLVFDPSVAGSGAPPTTNTFGAGAPGEIASALPGWRGLGDGTFEVATPSLSGQAANKGYVDSKFAGSDTAWTNLTYAANLSAGTPGQLAYRVKNGEVIIRGGGTKSTDYAGGTFVAVNATALPIALRPGVAVHNGTYGTGVRGAAVEVRPDGFIYATAENGVTGCSWVACDIRYPLEP